MAASPLLVARAWVTWRRVHLEQIAGRLKQASCVKMLAAGLCLLLLAPLLLTDVPPLLDYPNHLARAFVLAFRSGDAILSRMYEPHWQVIPNLAVDLVLPPLLHVFPVHVAGRMVIGLALIFPVLGTLAYNRAVFRTWHLWPLCSGLVAYNALLLLGFLNFLISVGLALLAAALWARFGDRWPVRAGLACMAACVAIFFAHLGGVLLFAVLVAAQEVEALWLGWRAGRSTAAMRRLALRRALLIAAIFLPTLLLYAHSSFRQASTSDALWLPAGQKLFDLAAPFLTYNPPLDLAAAVAVVLFIYLCVRTGRGLLPVRSRITLTVLVVLYAACPFAAKGGAWIDVRFPIMIGFVLFAGFTPHHLPRRFAFTAIAVFACLFSARLAVLSAVWAGHNEDVRELRASIAAVEPASRVLVAAVTPEDNPAYWRRVPAGRTVAALTRTEFHMAALLLIEHKAFWPLLFTIPGQQPLRVLPRYEQISKPIGEVPSYRLLGAERLSDSDRVLFPYLNGWEENFDYVLLLDAGGAHDLEKLLPERLQLVSRSDMAALFRIRPPTTEQARVPQRESAD